MPNCFRLYPKGSNQAAVLQDVDAAMCAHFGEPVDPKYWLGNWYNVIGFLIAVKGVRLGSPELRQEVKRWYDPALYGLEDAITLEAQTLRILDWLEANYVSDAWVEIGKR